MYSMNTSKICWIICLIEQRKKIQQFKLGTLQEYIDKIFILDSGILSVVFISAL